VVFVVRGPAPACNVVGRFSVRGRRGTNRVPFRGRVGRTTLAPGTYTVTARPVGLPRQALRVVLIVGDGRRERLDCSSGRGPAFLGAASFFATPGFTSYSPIAPQASDGKESQGVLPAIRRKIRALPNAFPRPPLPRTPMAGADGSPVVLGFAALALLALSALVILVYVIRFIRGPDTKSA
jgi:hypothetical protein